MKAASVSFFLGMISMLGLLVLGNTFFDSEGKDFDIMHSAFEKGFELQHNIMLNRTRINSVLKSKNIDDAQKEQLMRELWSVDNMMMLSQMSLLLETNESLSPLYQINSDKGKESFNEWISNSKQ